MARRRLTLPDPERLAAAAPAMPAPETKSMFPPVGAPPIARVAGDSAASAALAEMAGEMARARDEGRMILTLPLEAVDEAYLVRDRLAADPEDLAALMQSIAARGQQVPVEVVALEPGRYGLITGWRRLTALRRLAAEHPAEPRFARVLAVQRRPETAADAYLAMIEENEIRVGLSYYERARIVARAAERGVFPDTAAALSHLFATASRAKRSKIGSFLRLHGALDDALRFAAAIPERLGLALVKALDTDPGLAERLRRRLAAAAPATPDEELALLAAALKRPAKAAPADQVWAEQVTRGVHMSVARGRIVLEGPDVTALLQARLLTWLRGG